jgi:hypothetical protein
MANGADAPRLLHKYSQHGYTSHLHEAMRDEPEAIPLAVQDDYAQDAHRRDRECRIAAWRQCRSAIAAGVAAYEPIADRPALGDLRAISRSLRRIDQRLGAQ